MNGGRWTEQEHQSFLAGLRLYGREWKKVAAKIKTRTSAQIRSHAQKYFAKLARDDEMRKHSGLAMVMPGPVGYFSDGGSSVAQNSGDDDADASDASRHMARTHSAGQAKGTAAILIAPMGSAVSGLYKQSAGPTKKRSRAAVTGFEGQLGMGPITSSYPYKLQKRSNDATRVECLPSQEELLAKASPNLRHRLSSLIEAELCALQVLSCYALLQQQDQISAPRQKVKRQGRPRKLATATTAATGSAKASSLGLSMLTTEQIPSTSSIY
ncbi:LHY protein [Phytophthora cinnamomi]|uniref:LHY protein n=1 Tax=Phytophthora cinnamomi TaxID=4785 RepID=UPI00355A766E|nr:LHY protein [Phytophthora cinnamomi]